VRWRSHRALGTKSYNRSPIPKKVVTDDMIRNILTTFVLFSALPITATFSQQATRTERVQIFNVTVTKKGFQPKNLKLRANVPARITFIRNTDESCGTEVIIPEFSINRELPLDTPVVVEFTPDKAGKFSFACGMNMMRGKLIVRR